MRHNCGAEKSAPDYLLNELLKDKEENVYCGSPLTPGSKFCDSCGSMIET